MNKDGIGDCVLIVKGTDTSKIMGDEDGKELDRNRRGVVILFRENRHYKLAIENDTCFSSENEDGGVYFAPDLSVEVEGGNLLVRYFHGRYGYWQYTFRYQNSDFVLIGYDEGSDRGPVIESMTSINFLTQRKEEKVNKNRNAEEDDEVFKTTWENIKVDSLVKLSDIKDFDKLDMSVF